MKKLLGRLVFLQFLQKKGWMGVPASRSDWEGGDKNYLSHLIERYEGNNRLLSDVLEYLFFNTLNEKREGDIADVRLGEDIKIPYLNGGLFEKDNVDKLDIDFPYSYFKELMDFFAMYNFTIDENDPDDSEVGIDPEMFEKNDINIHVPEGAIPKDGPSAGITMVTSIVSTYTGRKVRERIAMTGETTLRGRVMPVGGIKEKILAAKRAGIKELILSEDNRKDISEIKAEYIDGLTFHYVRTNEDVLRLALEEKK